ncbi:hypothetical protein [Pantoea sp. BAV 3049]|uniref:hypothetical protein n=1 Tax=Pantoea sp. BAV 3049 TaxID=2654188 RepID=UPI00131D3FCA|nr:hypothetical protein [Pantoea sp. BAV 3049]
MSWGEEQAQAWLHWWHQGYWQLADESWANNGFYALPADQQQALAWQHPQAVAASFGIRADLPPEPQSRLLTLIELPGEAWLRLLALLAGICAPQAEPPGLSSANLIWCRRLARALRCESWLPAGYFQPYTSGSLILLRSLHPESWPRLRLLFPRDWVNQVAEYPSAKLPASRLAALLDAAIWQSQQPESVPNVDPQENNPA